MPIKIDRIDALLLAQNDTTNASPVAIRFTVLANGNLFYGKFGEWAMSTGSSNYDDTALEFSSVAAGQNWYIVDGTNLIVQSGSTGEFSGITTGAGIEPPRGARLVSLYRNRLVLGRTTTDPQNLFFSMVNNYTNFDYSNQTVIGAYALNLPFAAGEVGDIVTAFIPYSDDYAVIGLSDSVFVMHGDPRAGGNVDAVIRGVGIVDAEAWAFDPEGRLYFLSRRDLMMMTPGSIPTSVSQGRIQRFLSGIDFSTYVVRMAWDITSKGLWIFFNQRALPDSPPTHLFWDSRVDAFTFAQFPPIYGPTCMKCLTGETFLDRQIVLGNFTGQIWTLGQNWVSDNGTAINSYVQFTPLAMADEAERGMLTETEVVFGDEQQLNATVEWYTGDNAQEAIEIADAATGASVTTLITATGRTLIRARARGQTGVFRISNSTLNKRFSFETGICRISPAGRTRGH